VYIHQPDNYFYAGGSKTGMGYNENQYSLPRWTDLSVSRAGYYLDTFDTLVTQGWMFVPLVDYHGGGAAAAFEPLSQHLLEYEWASLNISARVSQHVTEVIDYTTLTQHKHSSPNG